MYQVTLFAFLIGCLGCTSAGNSASMERTVPVSGKIALDGKPLKNATIMFWPLKEKGNESTSQPYAEADAQGNYQLILGVGDDKRDGSPLGWYRVVVEAFEAPKAGLDIPPRLLSPEKYADPLSSPLVVEVVENPAPRAYELNLTK